MRLEDRENRENLTFSEVKYFIQAKFGQHALRRYYVKYKNNRSNLFGLVVEILSATNTYYDCFIFCVVRYRIHVPCIKWKNYSIFYLIKIGKIKCIISRNEDDATLNYKDKIYILRRTLLCIVNDPDIIIPNFHPIKLSKMKTQFVFNT